MTLKTDGNNRYFVMCNGISCGYLHCKVVDNCIYVYHIFIDEQYRETCAFTKWLEQFDIVYAIDVVPEAINYWRHIGAVIISYAKTSGFEDFEFIEGEDSDY